MNEEITSRGIIFRKIFTVSKLFNWSKSKTIQILYDKNKRQIILLYLTRATGNFLKIEHVKPGEL